MMIHDSLSCIRFFFCTRFLAGNEDDCQLWIIVSFGHQRERAVEPTTGRLTLGEGKGRPLHRRREGQVERTGEAERERERLG